MMDWLFTPLAWLFARHPAWRDRVGRAILRYGTHFFVLLALGCALAGFWDQFIHPFSSTLAKTSFDWLMAHRPLPYRADQDIVVLDIDEASLAGMNGKYGRWPWPREVLSQVAAALDAHHARAIAFDILFADEDKRNPSSEAAFDQYVQRSTNSFYPILRLNPTNDSQSEITLSMLTFASRDPGARPGEIDPSRTVALDPPYFKSIYDSTRMGTHNAYPDADNVIRWHQNYERIGGFIIPSLPYRMAEVLHWPVPRVARSLLNWPRGNTPYPTFSFIQVLNATLRNDGAYLDRFAGKTVLIGSTAPSLNDIKATPVDHVCPGIYVLATAVDNTKHGSFLQPLSPVVFWLLEILMLIPATWVFVHTELSQVTAKAFVVIPTVLLGVSLLSVSISYRLADLSAPTALVLTYFAIATVFEKHQRDHAFGVGVFAPNAIERSRQLQVACLPPTLTRHRVLALLKATDQPIRLWRPADFGLGTQWTTQGWVLWRYAPESTHKDEEYSTANVDGISLQWINVHSGEDVPEPFGLAQAIVRAAALSTIPISFL